MSDEADLPKALVKRLVKERLAARDAAAGDGEAAKSLQLNKDALLALSEGAKVFIQYLTAAANAVCKGAGRQTLSEDDVYAALADIQFAEFVPPLQEAAKAYKQRSKSSKAKAPAAAPAAAAAAAEPPVAETAAEPAL